MAATTARIALNATVAKACGVGNHLSGAAADPGWDQSDITVTLADANGQFAGAEYTNRSFGNVWCNAPAAVTLEVGALKSYGQRSTTPSSFTNAFDIQVDHRRWRLCRRAARTSCSARPRNGADFALTGRYSAARSRPACSRFGGANSIKVLEERPQQAPGCRQLQRLHSLHRDRELIDFPARPSSRLGAVAGRAGASLLL